MSAMNDQSGSKRYGVDYCHCRILVRREIRFFVDWVGYIYVSPQANDTGYLVLGAACIWSIIPW